MSDTVSDPPQVLGSYVCPTVGVHSLLGLQGYRGTSLIRNSPPPPGPPGIVLL